MTVTAVLDQPQWQVTVTITDLPVLPAVPEDPWPASPWTLYRSDGMHEAPVRGAFDRDLTVSSATVVRDNEYPISRPFLYVLRYVDATAGAVTVYSDWIEPELQELPRISDPITGTGVNATILTWPEFTMDARSTSFDVDGRDFPYVVVAAMSAPSSQLALRTTDAAGWRNLMSMTKRGQVLLVRPTVPTIDDAYVLVNRYALGRVSNVAADVKRIHTLDVQETGVPAPTILAAGTTLQDLADAYSGGTLQDIADDFTYLYEIAAAPL